MRVDVILYSVWKDKAGFIIITPSFAPLTRKGITLVATGLNHATACALRA